MLMLPPVVAVAGTSDDIGETSEVTSVSNKNYQGSIMHVCVNPFILQHSCLPIQVLHKLYFLVNFKHENMYFSM